MPTALTADTLLKYLTDELGIDEEIDETSKLFSTSLIDSFQMMMLVEHVEKTCGFRVPPDDITLENLDSVERILHYVDERGAAK